MQGSSGETDIENRIRNMRREEDRVMYEESNMEAYTTMYKIDSQHEFAVCLRELKQGLYIKPKGVGWGGNGREVQEGGDICILLVDSCSQKKTKFCKAIILQIKNK